MGLEESLYNAFREIILTAATRMPADVYEALKKAYEEEDNKLAKAQLAAILRNIELACRRGRPICQDTGTPYLYLELGDDFPLRSRVVEIFKEALRDVTREGALRPNAVDPIYARNSGDNTGRYIPWIHVDLVPGDGLKANFMLKGGGSEAPSRLAMSPPLRGWDTLKEAVVRAVAEYGPLPCPPLIVGVAVAGGGDVALTLAKKALFRPVGARHPDPKVARLEEELLEALNKLGVGPHGFGGRHSVLDVKFDYAHRHPASFAVGVVVGCWATRRSSLEVDSSGEWRITSRHLHPTGGGCEVS
ncbi:MAG: fumarate hydratase [Desulfurococcales archaeon]|nr:fumarate hydratase [Desulfurococcales archaeon]